MEPHRRQHDRRHVQRVVARSLLILALALVGGGCGGDQARSAAGSGNADQQPATPAGDPEADGDGVAVQPTAAAIASGRRLDRLTAAYAPVAARVSYLVAAETLRADAVAASAGEQVERQRFGSVRLEAARTRRVLELVRPRVAGVSVNAKGSQRVQTLLLVAIDRRMDAMEKLEQALDALADDGVPDFDQKQRVAAWREEWNASLRSGREALSLMQNERARLGLAPALEQVIR